MHTLLPFLMAMIAGIVLLNMLAKKLQIAYPILLVVAGLIVSIIPGMPYIQIDPDLIFLSFYHLYCLKPLGQDHSRKCANGGEL